MITKAQLTERTRGKGGTVVRLIVDPLTISAISNALVAHGPIPAHDLRRDTYVVKDLMSRKTFNKPGHVGIGPDDRGLAFDVTLDQIELA